MSLPEPIIVDLFDIEYKPSQVAIDHVGDTIESYGFSVDSIDDYDIRLWFNWKLTEDRNVGGKLIVDRMSRTFEITATSGDIVYTPLVTKDFDLIEEFLWLLEKDVNDQLE
jgi:hypothetical protein